MLGWKLRLEHSTVASLVKAGNTEEEPRRLGISATLDEVSTVLLHSSKEGEGYLQNGRRSLPAHLQCLFHDALDGSSDVNDADYSRTVASHESVNDEENVIEGQALQQVWATRTKSQELVRAHIHSKLVSVGYGPQAGPHIFWVLRGLGVWGLG